MPKRQVNLDLIGKLGDAPLTGWIPVEDALPPLPKGDLDWYVVLVQREGRPLRVRIAKWMRKRHREIDYKESYRKVLQESNKADWMMSVFKASEVKYWLKTPPIPDALS